MFAVATRASRRTEVSSELLCCSPLLTPDLDEADAAHLAAILKALADPIRLRLVNLVAASGELCACDLPEILNRSQPTVSHHLSQLVKAGILERQQRGKWAWFRLRPDQLDRVRQALS
ncbi:MAG: metalloregulator ArsR/SmtB family transcription factor [Acidimicrobiia bacterium]|nr:metalloregulator ArsR/SmtB family transcription factor [Acidimicrobiia bacterium]